MALKKPMKRPTAKTTTSPEPTAVKTAAANPAQKRRVAVPPPARKPVAPLVNPEPKVEAPKALPKRPVRKPAVKPAPPKDVKPLEPEKKIEPPVERKVGKSPEASKPASAAGGNRPEPEPRRADKPEVKRVSAEAMREMTLEERWSLFKKLNHSPEKFVPIMSVLPKQMQMRKDEALIRKIIEPKPPKGVKGKDTNYCPYCVDWQVFHYFPWNGYTRCTGCSMSTMDFYTRTDNDLWKRDV